MDDFDVEIHKGSFENAEAISALAILVFLDTYATDGVRPDLATEAFTEYSKERFQQRIEEPDRIFLLAIHDDGIVGFAELGGIQEELQGKDTEGVEMVRLYVQPRWQGYGIGKKLLNEVERTVLAQGGSRVWLSVWEENEKAISFYMSSGYNNIGSTEYEFQGNVYGNYVFAKSI